MIARERGELVTHRQAAKKAGEDLAAMQATQDAAAAAVLAEQGKFEELYKVEQGKLQTLQASQAPLLAAQATLQALREKEAADLSVAVGAEALTASGITADTPLDFKLQVLRAVKAAGVGAQAPTDPSKPPAPPTPAQGAAGAGVSAKATEIRAQIAAVANDWRLTNHERLSKVKELQATLRAAT
jgi:hypothetical protein